MLQIPLPRAAFALVTLLLVAGFGFAPAAQADRIDPTMHRLPHLVSGGAAAATEDAIYLFGGLDSFAGRALDEIVRYDPATGSSERIVARLPHALMWSTAAYDGTHVYIFGGRIADGSWQNLGTIIRFDPTTETVETLDVELPVRVLGASAVWTGEAILVFGGSGCPARHHDAPLYRCQTVQRFVPASGEVTLMRELPFEFAHGNAVLVGDHVYLLAGLQSSYNREIIRYDPETGAVRWMQARLDPGRYGAAAFAIGGHIYLVGGHVEQPLVNPNVNRDARQEAWRYDVAADRLVQSNARLWEPRASGHAFVVGSEAVILGGDCSNKSACLDVLRYTLPPASPRNITAMPELGGMRVSWTPPHKDSSALGIEGYRVYILENNVARLLAETEETDYLAPPCPSIATCVYAVSAYNSAGDSGHSAAQPGWLLRVPR